jgi:hypothetical protein
LKQKEKCKHHNHGGNGKSQNKSNGNGSKKDRCPYGGKTVFDDSACQSIRKIDKNCKPCLEHRRLGL